jgi:hypothetical protein
VQSLILSAILIVGGITIALAGVLADLIAANKRMLEELVWREKLAGRGVMEQKFGPITVDRSWANRPTLDELRDRMAAQAENDSPPRRVTANGAVDAA